MPTEVSTVLVVVIAIIALVALVVAAGLHIWYALGLTRVFAQRETETWRAWVPLLNEAEVLRLGRIDPVKVALYLVPIVAIHAIVLKAIAAHRLNVEAGRGAGSTVLAVILPPLWATLLGQSLPATAPSRADRDEVPVPPPGSAFTPPPPAFTVPPAGGTAAPVPAGASASSAAPGAAAPARPASTAAPAPPPPAPPAPAPAPPAPHPPAAAPAPARPEPVGEEPAPLTRRARRGDDATAIVRPPAGWELLLPSGESIPIAARTVVLGRNPNPAESSVQYLAVSDEARTVSKHHARLQWDGQSWTITDLGSTNGVSVIDSAGAEHPLPAEGTASVVDRFVLGDAVLVLRRPGV